MSKDITGLLKRASNAAPREALILLVEAWRIKPAPRIAQLVEALSDQAETGLGPLPGKTAKARLAAALKTLESYDPVELPRILRSLSAFRVDDAMSLVEALAAAPPDPRVLSHVLAWMRAPPYTSSGSHKVWRRLFKWVCAQGDPRAAEALDALDLGSIVESANAAGEFEAMRTRALAAAGKTAEPPGLLSGEEEAACAALEGALANKTVGGHELLQAVYANLDDMEARSVYGDWLSERGDPRGKLIAAQIAHAKGQLPWEAARAAEKKLLDAHADVWLGAIGPAIERGQFSFELGFLSEVALDSARAVEVASAPEWRTVRRIWLEGRDVELPLGFLRSLKPKFIGGLNRARFAALYEARSHWVDSGLRGLGLEPQDDAFHPRDWQTVESFALELQSIDELFIERRVDAKAEEMLWIARGPLKGQLQKLGVQGYLNDVPKWIVAAETDTALREIAIRWGNGTHGWYVVLSRGQDNRFSKIVATGRPTPSGWASTQLKSIVEHVLDETQTDQWSDFTVRVDGVRATKADVESILAAAHRQTRLEWIEVPGRGRQPVDLAARGAAAPKLKEVRAAEKAQLDAKSGASRDEVANALALIDPPAAEALSTIDLEKPASLDALAEAIRARADERSEWVNAALAVLALDGRGANLESLRFAALRYLARIKPTGLGKNYIAILEREEGPRWEVVTLLACNGVDSNNAFYNEGDVTPSLFGSADLPYLLDWFENRRGKSPPRADQVYYAVRATLAKEGTTDTLRELEARMKAGVGKWQEAAYKPAISTLKRRATDAAKKLAKRVPAAKGL